MYGDLWSSDPPTSPVIYYHRKHHIWRLGILMTKCYATKGKTCEINLEEIRDVRKMLG